MSASYLIDLTITLDGSGKTIEQIAAAYLTTALVDDIAETALNLCGDDPARLEREFGGLSLLSSDVRSKNSACKLTARLSVLAASPAFIEQIVAGYMDGFADCIRRTASGVWSREGRGKDFNLQPLEWDVKVSETVPQR